MSAPLPFEDLAPAHRHRWEEHEGGLVTVLVPKFTGRFARRWLVPLLARPEMRVRLDELGSFVWRQCDGSASIRQIAGRVAERFGGDPGDNVGRVVRFVRKLAREESLTFHPPGGPA